MVNRSHRFTMEPLEDRTVPAISVGTPLPTQTDPRTATGHVHHVSVDLPQTGPNAGLAIGASNDAEVRFVQKLYFDLLGRGIDTGAQGYIDALTNGQLSRHDVADSILHSDEYDAHQINGIFKAFLNRDADQASLDGYVKAVKDGMSLEDVTVDVLSSDEYRSRHAGNAQFVTAIFDDVLGRFPDPAAATGYTDRYAAADAKEVHAIVDEIVKSSESRQLGGEAAVELMLNQKPTASVGANFVADARNGAPIESVLADLAASDAYFALDVVK
jgi:hypothetical protein